MGWFCGFKLHIVINNKGEISQSLFEQLFIADMQLITNLKTNLKDSLILMNDHILFRKIDLVEIVNDEQKIFVTLNIPDIGGLIIFYQTWLQD
jgi:hypothetical protein